MEIYKHIQILNTEQSQTVTQLAVLNNRVEMLEKWFWLFAVIVVGALVTAIANYVRHGNLEKDIGRKK
jgi:hypothetical protein